MASLSLIVRGVLSNWSSMLVGIAVTFWLSPFVVHRLGDSAYGVWMLATSLIAYMAILDFGLRGSVTHFIAQHHTRQEHGQASQIISVAFLIRAGLALVIILVSIILASLVDRFLISPELLANARIVMVLTGCNLAITLSFGMFGAILAALHRFDLLSAIAIGQTLAVAAVTVFLLKNGHGLIAVATVQLIGTILAMAAQTLLSLRAYPELRIRWHRPSGAIVRPLASYGFFIFLISISGQLVYYSDNVVVGAFLSAEAVTLYAIGGRLIEYQRQLATSLGQTLMPVASSYSAANNMERMGQLLLQGTRVALLVSWPIQIALFLRGHTFIRLWMGEHYADPSARIMQILLLSNFFIAGNSVSANIAFGLGKHKLFAIWQSVEAVANLALSIWLVHVLGFTGVAWGTTIPSLITQGVIWPIYICRIVQTPLGEYWRQTWLRMAVALVPFGLACLYVERHWAPGNLGVFFLQMALLVPVALIGVALVFLSDLRTQVQQRWGRRPVPSPTV